MWNVTEHDFRKRLKKLLTVYKYLIWFDFFLQEFKISQNHYHYTLLEM